jgi:hypothetical protein
MSQWCNSCDTEVLLWCYSGVTARMVDEVEKVDTHTHTHTHTHAHTQKHTHIHTHTNTHTNTLTRSHTHTL